MLIYTCVRVRVYSQDPCDGPGCRQGVRLAQRPAAEQEQHLLQHGARRQPRVRPVMADTMTSVITTKETVSNGLHRDFYPVLHHEQRGYDTMSGQRRSKGTRPSDAGGGILV